jgi:hypothetical protein
MAAALCTGCEPRGGVPWQRQTASSECRSYEHSRDWRLIAPMSRPARRRRKAGGPGARKLGQSERSGPGSGGRPQASGSTCWRTTDRPGVELAPGLNGRGGGGSASTSQSGRIDPINCLVLGYDQATDMALKLDEGVRRKHRRKKRGIVPHKFGNLR